MYTQMSNVHAYVHSKVVEKLVGVSLSEVEYVVRDCALHEVKYTWMMKAERRSNWEWCKISWKVGIGRGVSWWRGRD